MHRRIGGYTLAVVDLLTALVVVFAAMAVLSVIAQKKQAKAGIRPGALIVTLTWDVARNADVDLWVKAPGDAPVGYSHKSDADCDLLRDDLGRAMDPSSRNEEMIVCRVAPSGEWIVNAMLYRTYDRVLPVRAKVALERLGSNGTTALLERGVVLTREGEQLTVWRFTLDARGRLVPGSVNDAPMALTSGVAAQ